jgi:hypothetical protein
MHHETRIWINGIYRHFKGGSYQVIEVATDSETSAFIVLYRNLGTGAPWSRAAKMWNEFVKWPDGEMRSRFVLEAIVQPSEARDLKHLFEKKPKVEEGGTANVVRATSET